MNRSRFRQSDVHRRTRSCCGQALVEFVFVMTTLIIVCIEIYQMINWSRDNISVQGGAWFVARSQTFDFLHNNTPESLVKPLLQQTVFGDRPVSVSLETEFAGSPSDIAKYVGGDAKVAASDMLYAFSILGLPSLDFSLVRRGTVSVSTPDYFQDAPFDLAKSVTHMENGRRYFSSVASAIVYTSWTSAAQNHDYDQEKAEQNSKTGKNAHDKVEETRKELLEEAAQKEQEAQEYLRRYQAATGEFWKNIFWTEYLHAEQEAQKLRDQAAGMAWPTPTPSNSNSN